ncbi:virulence-associated E family protein [Leptothoe sp. ISB3NOV94-8A]
MLTDSKNGHCSGGSGRENLGQKKGQRYSPSPISTGNRNSFDIRDHVDKLTPAKEKGRYICPVCEDDNFTIRENDGAFQCWSNGCDSQAIMDAIAPLKQRPQSANGTSQKRKPRKKSRKQKDRDIEVATAELECKVDELIDMVQMGYETKETADVKLAEWCKQEGRHRFTASKLFNARVKERLPATSPDEKPRLLREYEQTKQYFGQRLRLNTIRKEIEVDGKPMDLDTLKVDLLVDYGLHLKSSREDIHEIIVKIAKVNAYNPVVEYLTSVADRHGDDTSILDDIATRHFGSEEPVCNLMVKRFLIAAVARAHKPGCKHDCALILQGPQEARKSTWLKTLASSPWFDDGMGSSSDKDEKIKMHCRWIVEWAELETVFRRKDISQAKAFMSSSTDFLRPPYGRKPEDLHRQSVIAGTTNEGEFLSDPTGSRRFWVVPVRKRIDVTTVRSERDRIWAAATLLYRQNVRWWWETTEDGDINELNKPYQTEHPWKALIAARVNGSSDFTTEWLLTHVIGMDVKKQSRKSSKEVGTILRELGFELSRSPVAQPTGPKKRVWRPKFQSLT